MKKILITDNRTAKDYSEIFYPRIIMSREEAKTLDKASIDDVWLDGTDTAVLNDFTSAQSLKYIESMEYSNDLTAIRKQVKKLVVYTIPAPEPTFKIEDDFILDGSAGAQDSVPLDSDSAEQSEIPLAQQIELTKTVVADKRIGAGTFAELTMQMVNICNAEQLFLRDKITGLYRSRYCKKSLVPAEQAYTIFYTHFCDKLALQTVQYKTNKDTGDAERVFKYRQLKRDEMQELWKNVNMYATFNSRKEFYESIPKWDGVARIETFMKDYFNCDTNPHFFLLLITSIIGKIHNPAKNYVPYFFDFVSPSKGIGKTWLWQRLLRGKYVGDIKMQTARGMSDFFVDCYDGNNVVVLDDECNWCGKGVNKITHAQFKNLVSATVDKFSRKHMNPEEHIRCFVIVRTSNEINQVYETNERRQIIFRCNLKERECRIKNLPDEYFEQILAEGKAYYEQHGLYEMTESDWNEVMATNVDNFELESPENFIIMDYINAIRSAPDAWGVRPVASKFHDCKWGNYKKYVEYCAEEKVRPVSTISFWRRLKAMSDIEYLGVNIISESKYDLAGGGKSRLFAVNNIATQSAQESDPDADLEDVPF